MIAITRLPYYTLGALLGLFVGYLYAALQIVQYVPGLRWLENWIRYQLPQRPRASHMKDDKADIASRPGSFAVMDSAALGNALYAMEKPASTTPGAAGPFQEPHLASDTPAAAAAAAANGRQHQGLAVTFSEDYTPHNHLTPAQQQQREQQQHEVLLNVRERLASFPIDNMSPTTTATALSLATAGLAPSGNSVGEDDDIMHDDQHEAHTSGLDIGVGPMYPIEGELDIKYASSSNNIAPNSAAAAAAAPQGDDVQSLLPAAAAAAAGRGLDRSKDVPTRTPAQTKKFTIGAPVGSSQSGVLGTSPGISHTPMRAVPGGTATSPAVHRSTVADNDIVPLTDRAVQELNQQQADLALKGSNPSAGLLTDQGSPRPAYTVGLPAQRQIVTQVQRSRSGSLNGDAAAQQQQGVAAGYPATAAGYSQTAGLSADVAASDFAPGTPRSMSSMHTLSSIKTSDSVGTMEKKKKKGLFAALKQKAVKGRQQVR